MKKINILLAAFIVVISFCLFFSAYCSVIKASETDDKKASSCQYDDNEASTKTALSTKTVATGECQGGSEGIGNNGKDDVPKGDEKEINYVLYNKDASEEEVAKVIQEYVENNHITKINGYDVTEDNINEVARKIIADANTKDIRNVSLLFGGLLISVYIIKRKIKKQ